MLTDRTGTDPEVLELASAIAGEAMPEVLEESKSVSSPSKPVSPEGKPAAAGKATTSEEGAKTGDGEEGKEGEPGEGGQEDPFKDVTLKVLLEHPVLGPKLQSWSDGGVAAQVTAALERERPALKADAQKTATERSEDEHFSSMTREQIAEEIAESDEAATAYARFQQRRQASGELDPEGVARASQIYSYATKVASVSSLLEDSGLTAEAKAGLKPENFTHLGAQGIVEWEKAVFTAVVAHEVQQGAQKLLDDKWETYKQEQLAELDGERPAITSGRRTGPAADLLTTSSGTILEAGLAKAEAERAQGKR